MKKIELRSEVFSLCKGILARQLLQRFGCGGCCFELLQQGSSSHHHLPIRLVHSFDLLSISARMLSLSNENKENLSSQEGQLRKRERVDSPLKMAGELASTERFLVKKISSDAVLPRRGSAKAAGYDLSRCVNHFVGAGNHELCSFRLISSKVSWQRCFIC